MKGQLNQALTPRLRASTVLHSNLTKLALCFAKPLHLIPRTGYTVKDRSSTSSHRYASTSG